VNEARLGADGGLAHDVCAVLWIERGKTEVAQLYDVYG
jgi:hypothetical protein